MYWRWDSQGIAAFSILEKRMKTKLSLNQKSIEIRLMKGKIRLHDEGVFFHPKSSLRSEWMMK